MRYLKNNLDSLVNYGRRYRNGQRISTAFMESAVNQLIDKRMSKSQQMRWSPMGAHLLLQVRAELVDGRLVRHSLNGIQVSPGRDNFIRLPNDPTK